MAITSIKDGVVSRVNRQGYGVQVSEEYEVDGKVRSTKWTVWFKEPHGLQVGDRISVSGFHSDKVGEFEDETGQIKRYVERSLNAPRIADTRPGAGSLVESTFGASLVNESAPF